MRHVPFILDATRRKSSMVMDALNNGKKKKKALRIKELTTYSKVNSWTFSFKKFGLKIKFRFPEYHSSAKRNKQMCVYTLASTKAVCLYTHMPY